MGCKSSGTILIHTKDLQAKNSSGDSAVQRVTKEEGNKKLDRRKM
jgi:hypothetical protein